MFGSENLGRIHLLSMLLLVSVSVCGCFGNLFDFGGGGGGGSKAGPLYNGFLCSDTTSAWRCESSNGASFDFALYLLTSDGIEVMTASATSVPVPHTLDWTQPKSNRVEFTTDDGQAFVMSGIKGSTDDEMLDFTLERDGQKNESFHCALDTVTLLDANCDGIIDALAPPTPTPTATPSP
jgi:hypothetical protein